MELTDRELLDARRYRAKRKAVYLCHLSISTSYPMSEDEFNKGYDYSADKNIEGYIVDHTGQFVKEPLMQMIEPGSDS